MTAPAPDRRNPRLPRSLLRRVLSGAAALALTTIGAVSCTGVLSLDGYQSAADAICTLLDGCYASGGPKNCQAHIDTIGQVTQQEADDWLHVIGKGCLDNCTAARICLDVEPVCLLDVGVACTAKEDCCRFSKGARDCVEGVCCVTAGQRCTADSDCCAGVGVCNPKTGTCGGTQCREPGLPCDIGAQCCTGLCRDKICSDTICDADGFGCKPGDDRCCSGYCDETQHCGKPKECGLLRAPCTADADCCGPDGSSTGGHCYLPPGAPVGLCSNDSACAPLEADCSNDDQCCTGQCDPTYHKCGEACLDAGTGCAVDAECCSGKCDAGACSAGCSRAYCKADADCCTDRCISGTCAPACSPTSCEHTACQLGGPLGADCGACVAEVCLVDPFCCCNAWDSFCVVEAQKQPLCGCI